MSQTKKTLLMLLREQIAQLHPKIQQMDPDSLVKQVAKHKIIYQLSNRENPLELVYSYIALCDCYIQHGAHEPAIKALHEAQSVRETGDAEYLLGVCLWAGGKGAEAERKFEACLGMEWVEPSGAHRRAQQLEAISYRQKILFSRWEKNSAKKQQTLAKLVDLCYDKLKLIQKHDNENNNYNTDSYYQSLAMADLAEVYCSFGQYPQAHEKITTAIQLMQGQPNNKDKLISFYLISSKCAQRIKKIANALIDLKKGIELMENGGKSVDKLPAVYERVYHEYIRLSLGL